MTLYGKHVFYGFSFLTWNGVIFLSLVRMQHWLVVLAFCAYTLLWGMCSRSSCPLCFLVKILLFWKDLFHPPTSALSFIYKSSLILSLCLQYERTTPTSQILMEKSSTRQKNLSFLKDLEPALIISFTWTYCCVCVWRGNKNQKEPSFFSSLWVHFTLSKIILN